MGHTPNSSMSNGFEPIIRNLTNPISVTAIRIRIISGENHKGGGLPLRFELYGCKGKIIDMTHLTSNVQVLLS